MLLDTPHTSALAEKALEVDHVERCVNNDSEATPVKDFDVRNREEHRLVRKLDMIMMPMLWLMYWLNYLDRNAITVARLNNLEKDLQITSVQYQTCVSILFVGYILGQVPASKCAQWILQRFFP